MQKLIIDSFGTEAGNTWAAFSPTEAQLQMLSEAGRELLTHFPTRAGSCALMSAMYSILLEKRLPGVPCYVVVGSLFIGDTRIFDSNDEADWKAQMSQSNASWDGHAWIIVGDHLADVSIFRTAYSSFSHPVLAAHVIRTLGRGRGLLVCKIGSAIQTGLRYEPQYVLTQDEVDALARGAKAMIFGPSDPG